VVRRGRVRYGEVCSGLAWQVRSGTVWRGKVWLGAVWCGEAGKVW
jgi:hypothetical protein